MERCTSMTVSMYFSNMKQAVARLLLVQSCQDDHVHADRVVDCLIQAFTELECTILSIAKSL